MISYNDQTRDRILQAAVEIFAERGFRDSTVRDICAQAKVNGAAVNYYFRSKEALYLEALQFAFQQSDEHYPQDAARDTRLPPQQRLKHFIRTYLLRLLDDSRLGWHSKLIAREIAEPTGALDSIIDTAMRPRCAVLQDIVLELFGRSAWSAADLQRVSLSIVGQCLVFHHCRSLIDRMYPEIIADVEAIERTVDLIFDYSLGGLKALAERHSP